MRRTLAVPAAAFAGLVLALGLAAGCGDAGSGAGAPEPSSSDTTPQSLPPLTFKVTKKASAGSVRYEVAIDAAGRWQTTGDVARSGTLTADQVRTLAAAVNSNEFTEQMAAKRDVGAPKCAAVLPDYYWMLETGGVRATNSCAPKRPAVDQVVTLIRQYAGA